MVSDKASAASSSEMTAVFDNAATKARPDPGLAPDPTARTANTNDKEADAATIADAKSESNLDLEQALSAPVPLGGEEVTVTSDEVPNGGYGWVIVICLLGVNACTWGINTTYGVFSSYFLEFNYYTASQLDYAWVGGLAACVSVMMGPLANLTVRLFGFKPPMLFGVICVGVGQCCAGLSKSFGVFLVCQGLVFGIGLGFTVVPSQPILAHWFDKRLALAQGIAAAGSGVGGLIFANVTPLLLHSHGVKNTYIIIGCISLGVLLPATILLRGRHKALGAKSAPLQLHWLWHPGYRYVIMWAILTMMAYFIAIYTIASYCTNALGMSQQQGGAIQSLLAAGQIIGRPFWGYALDRGGRINMVIVSYIICGVVTLAAWMPARSFGVMAFYALINGATGGTVHMAIMPMTASIVGVQDLASALAMYWIAIGPPNLLGQAFAIMLVDYSKKHLHRTGADAYQISIGFAGGLLLASAMLLTGAKHYKQGSWKIFQKV